MDIATLIGVGGSVVLVVVGIVIGGGNIMGYIDPPSIAIVVGGTVMSMLAGYPLSRVKQLLPIFKRTIFAPSYDPGKTIGTLVNMCGVVRREGLLALDALIQDLDDPFLIKGAQFVVDGADPEMTRMILETDVGNMRQRHSQARGMMEYGGAMAPAYGMIGTLIGLVAMLANLSDTATLGPKMAVALLTTFYGSMIANVVFLPLANKLKLQDQEECLISSIIIEGLLGIQAGENPRNLEDKLKAFLPVSQRASVGGESAGSQREAA